MTMANALGLGVQKSRGGAGAAPPAGPDRAYFGPLAEGEVPTALLPGSNLYVAAPFDYTARETLSAEKPIYGAMFPIAHRPTAAYWRLPGQNQDVNILATFDTQTLNIGGAVYTLYTHPNPGQAFGVLPIRWVG